MSLNKNQNGNKPMKSASQRQELSASDFRLEFILTGTMIAFAAVVYIVLSVSGVTPGLSQIFSSKKMEDNSPPPHYNITDDIPSDISVTDLEVIQPEAHDMGNITLFLGRTMTLAPEEETCISYTSSFIPTASVEDDGTVTPMIVGETDITGKAASGNTYTWHVSVRKVIYLTFRDFPNDATNTILDVLKENDVKATFFVCMRTKEEYFPIYRRIIDEGHTIGNHTSSHDTGVILSRTSELKDSIIKLENYLDLNFSYRTKILSIPNGTTGRKMVTVSNRVAQELHDMGYTLVDWTIYVGDNRDISKEKIIENVKTNAKSAREIIAMHNYGPTASALPEIIQWLRENGYEFERLDDAPYVYNQYYEWEPNVNQFGAGTYTKDMISGFQYTQNTQSIQNTQSTQDIQKTQDTQNTQD